jgi:hypothetical protein
MAVSTNCSRELARASGIFPALRLGSFRIAAGISTPHTDSDEATKHLFFLTFVPEKAQTSPL